MKPFLSTGLIIVVVLASQQLFSQSNFRFRHYDTKDGLASETTESIVQDSLGFIWIKYYGAVSRFDGYNFKVYQFDPIDSSKSIGSGHVYLSFLDTSGNLWLYRWIGGQGQYPKRYFSRYDRSKDSFTSYLLDLKTERISPCIDAGTTTIWIGGDRGSGLFAFNYTTSQQQTIINHHYDSLINVAQNSYRGIVDNGSYLLLASGTGLWKFDKREMTFSRPPCDPKDTGLLYHNPASMARISTNRLEVGIDNNNYHTDDKLSSLKKINIPATIKQYATTSSAWTGDGIHWVTTAEKGLFRFDPVNDSVTNIINDPSDPYSLRSNWLNDVMVDRDGNIWVCTQERGISVLRKQDLEFHNYKIGGFGNTAVYEANNQDFVVVARTDAYPPQPESVNEFLVAPLPKGQLNSLRFQKIKTDKTIKGTIYTLAKGKSNLWVISEGHGVLGFPIETSSGRILAGPIVNLMAEPRNPNTLSSNNIGPVLEDPKGNLWVSIWNEGLNKINSEINYGAEGSVEKFIHSPNDPTTISNNIVYDLLRGNRQSLWALTSSGVDRLRNGRFEHVFKDGFPMTVFESTDSTVHIGTADGLYVQESRRQGTEFRKELQIKGAVHRIEKDGLGRLWLSNLEGITCYDPKEKIALRFSEEEGIDHTHGIIEKSSSGTFITANIEGISIFDPLSLKVNREKTFPVLTKLLVNNQLPGLAQVPEKGDDFTIPKDISVLSELVIDYKHNNFSIEFSAMQMTAPDKNLYRHKLEGYDIDWIETDSKNRTATYTNLPADDYTFKVQASNHHGVWSDQERTLKVKILPPPWRTGWAYTGYLMLFAASLILARRTIVQRERLKSNLKLEQVEREKEHLEFEKAKEVDKMKSAFFANISHEFRTPLTLIKGPVEILLDKFKDDPVVKERLKLVQQNSDLLLKLINQLLDLARLESGTLRVEKSEGDLYSFVRAIASSFTSFASQKNITVNINVPVDRFAARFDKDKLETILINLINNAIKFTPNGGKVSVSAVVDKDQLSLSVKDTGIGIADEHQQRIFERFHQVSDAHKEVGTGIGLALVKELIALLDGNITLKSKPREGSQFIVVLPVEIIRSPERENTAIDKSSIATELSTNESLQSGGPLGKTSSFKGQTEDLTSSSKPHVLVVEDNADLRGFIIDSLGTEFYFLEAENGRQGLEAATQEIPDLIISDVMMPEMDGITMAGKIKNDIRTSHISLILLTAKSTEDSKLSGLQSGADDYLTKPFNKNELLLKVRNGVTRQIKLREKLRAELMSTAPKVEVLSADEQFLNDVKEDILGRLSDEQLSVESLADDIGMSRVQLYRKISGLTGLSVNELIRKLRLQRAAQLLGQNWGPVSQVAYEVGFSNLSYFSKVFKEEYGVLPSEYSQHGK